MCGRFSTATLPIPLLAEIFGIQPPVVLEGLYNVAPTLPIPIIRERGGRRHLDQVRWGLIPSWSKEVPTAPLINARLETLPDKPSFRDSLHSRRCIVPAAGFYEWRKTGKSRQPYFIFRADRQPLAMAGLWDRWVDRKTGEVIESCVIITAPATAEIEPLHDRMPVILDYDSANQWLDLPLQDASELLRMLEAGQGVELQMHPVSDFVSNARHEGERCVEPIDLQD
jgi:putative SOS response-associated peptidase YedK